MLRHSFNPIDQFAGNWDHRIQRGWRFSSVDPRQAEQGRAVAMRASTRVYKRASGISRRGRWALFNAFPDIRQQIAENPEL
ncbi:MULTISPECIES: hypothetical protein [unclassified Mesorhizobium]|uniref:hypothetical protein n=1 Tax=unclassified Mesorhizobium TaxID=325217 RepID=UPI001129E522|nr:MULTISPECIES: hypothetical protein [unclassified Mesorhizobium]TPJ66279.1 hypothetical protein FJ462_17105 [Mesorhizobium sp. B2-6-7]TPJ94841.1 hypothetical protein FJ489_17620 [Mesorhizobium sp. B2-5-12]